MGLAVLKVVIAGKTDPKIFIEINASLSTTRN